MTTKISYGRSEDAWHGYDQFLVDLIDKYDAKSICDIGGGANPVLNQGYILKKGVNYSILDISETEVEKAPRDYKKIVADIASPEFVLQNEFDFVFSKMLAEHIKDAEQFHKNALKLLTDGGLAVHFFPTLYALPFLVNYLAPEKFSETLLRLFAPRDEYQHAKFPAYYDWCRGPTGSQMQKFNRIGYEVIEYRGFFGHGAYYNKIRPLKKLHEFKTKYLLKNPHPYFTSFAYVVLRKSNPYKAHPF